MQPVALMRPRRGQGLPPGIGPVPSLEMFAQIIEFAGAARRQVFAMLGQENLPQGS